MNFHKMKSWRKMIPKINLFEFGNGFIYISMSLKNHYLKNCYYIIRYYVLYSDNYLNNDFFFKFIEIKINHISKY